MNNYLPRLVDKEVEDLLEIMGCVLIEGCKWSGKSTTASQKAKSIVYFQNPDMRDEYDRINNTKPSLFLLGDKPRMFDEWQMYPVIWDSIRSDIDLNSGRGMYILTGSTKCDDSKIMHSGTGRIAKIKMRPMSLFESGDSSGEVSLTDLFSKKDIESVNNFGIEDVANLIIRGGWPNSVDNLSNMKYKVAAEYVKSLLEEEIKLLDNTEKNKAKMLAVLKSLSRNVSTCVSNKTILDDVCGIFNNNVSRPTLDYYLDTLEKLYIIENIYATNLNIRSRIAIRTKPKKIFVDPSIAAASLGLTADKLVNDLNYFGFIFENLCFRDLLIYSQSLNAEISFYRDENDFEVDAIITMPDGKWGAIEIKLGSGYIDAAALNLLKFKEKVDTEKCGEPEFLMVLTGTNYSYRRDDGVYVVSILSLRN